MIDFGLHLRNWRARHGLSEKEAAAILAVSTPTILLWEKRRIRPPKTEDEIIFLRRMENFQRAKSKK